jgi:hypothetical protein
VFQVAFCPELLIEQLKQRADRISPSQPLTKAADRVFIRRRLAKLKLKEPQPAQAVPDQELHSSVADVVLRRQDQDLVPVRGRESVYMATGSYGGRPPFALSP